MDAKSSPEEEELEASLVWIYGSPRSGSTWLLEQLCDPVRLTNRSPTGFEVPRSATGTLDALPVNEFLISSHIAPALGDPVEVDDGLMPATLNNYLGHKPAYLFARDFADVWRPEVRRLVLARLAGTLARARAEGVRLAPRPLIVIKEVNGSHAADLIMSLFPRSKLLFLVRDGRDALDSRVHALGEGGWMAEFEGAARFTTDEERLEWVRSAARRWSCEVDAVQRAFDHHPPELRRIVRYEELLADTVKQLGGAFEWLGLARDPERLGEIAASHAFSAIPADKRGTERKRRAATPGLWRENLTPAEQAVVRESMSDRLARLGYEP